MYFAFINTTGSLIPAYTLLTLNSEKTLRKNKNISDLDREKYGFVYDFVEKCCNKKGIKVPTLLYHPHPTANIFAYYDSPCILIYDGALKYLNKEELEGLIGHELTHIYKAHVKKRLIGNLIAPTAIHLLHRLRMAYLRPIFYNKMSAKNAKIANITSAFALNIAATFAHLLLLQKFCRSQELEADRIGAEMTGRPKELASGIKKLNGNIDFGGLFSTHPTTSERVKALEKMACEA